MLKPYIKKISGVWWLFWSPDPNAIAYEAYFPDSGKKVQAGKNSGGKMKLGTIKPVKMPTLAAGILGPAEVAVDVDAPQPTPTGWPYLSKFGISDGSDIPQSTLDKIKAIDSRCIARIDVYAMGGYAKPMNDAIAQGIPVLGTMCGTLKPSEVGQDSVGNPDSTWPKRYTPGWCGKVAAFYEGKVPVWEHCNEPDGQGWSATAYAVYFADCAEQIKLGDPGCKVSTGGVYRSAAGYSIPEYAEAICVELRKRNRPDLMDYFAVHPYEDFWPDPKSQWEMTFPLGHRAPGDTAREILDANGFAHVPIIATEYGKRFPKDESDFANAIGVRLDMVKPGFLTAGFIFRLDGTHGEFLDCVLISPNGQPRQAYGVFKSRVNAQ